MTSQEYNDLILECLESVGGAEECVRQLISEPHYNKLIQSFVEKHKEDIVKNVGEKYEQLKILSSKWNRYLFKVYLLNTDTYELTEYNIKHNIFRKQVICEDEEYYGCSFFANVHNGPNYWDNFKMVKTGTKFTTEGNKVNIEEIMKDFTTITPEQDKIAFMRTVDDDGIQRCMMVDGKICYKTAKLKCYMTFNKYEDVLADKEFYKHFYENIMKKVNSN